MEQNKYAKELREIKKIKNKIALKKANGMDTEADEREEEIAMLELLAKVHEDIPKPKVIPADEIEAKRMINNARKQVANADLREYCMVLLDVLDDYLDKNRDIFATKDEETIIYTCDVMSLFINEMHGAFYEYADDMAEEEWSKSRDDLPELVETYPALKRDFYELNKEDSIQLVKTIFERMKDLNQDIRVAMDDKRMIMHLSQLYFCYAIVFIELTSQIRKR